MPRKKQKISDLPTEEAIRKIFPKKVVDIAKQVAHEKDDKPKENKGKKKPD